MAAPNAAGQLHVFDKQCLAVAVNSAKVGIFEQPNEKLFSSVLGGFNSFAAPAFVASSALFEGDVLEQSPERVFLNEEISGVLVSVDFPENLDVCRCFLSRGECRGLRHLFKPD